MASFKCTLWGSIIKSTDATNLGQWREQFEVVIAGSDGWTLTATTQPNPAPSPVSSAASNPVSSAASSALSSAASSSASSPAPSPTPSPSPAPGPGPAPPSCHGYSAPKTCNGKAIMAPEYHLGSTFFPGPFNPIACGDFAQAQAQVNVQAGSSQSVAMFNAYYLHRNGKPLGTYCSLYDMVVDPAVRATYGGETVGGDEFTCQQSWVYAKSI